MKIFHSINRFCIKPLGRFHMQQIFSWTKKLTSWQYLGNFLLKKKQKMREKNSEKEALENDN